MVRYVQKFDHNSALVVKNVLKLTIIMDLLDWHISNSKIKKKKKKRYIYIYIYIYLVSVVKTPLTKQSFFLFSFSKANISSLTMIAQYETVHVQ